jgi:hypothetical protein
MSILALFQCIQPLLSKTDPRRLSRIVQAMLSMTGRMTMLGISRWAGKSGSYQSVQRFFNTSMAWPQVFVKFFDQHLCRPGGEYFLVGDESVTPNPGKRPMGWIVFFSGLLNKTLTKKPGLSVGPAQNLFSTKTRAYVSTSPTCRDGLHPRSAESRNVAAADLEQWREHEQRAPCAKAGFGGRFPQGSGDAAKQTKTLWKIDWPALAKHDILRRYLRLSIDIRHPRGKVVDRRGIASPGQDGIRLAD